MCKSRKSLIESSAFIDIHLSRQNDDANLFLLKVVTKEVAGFLELYITRKSVEVYSLSRGCWKSLTAAVVPKGYMESQDHVFLNGALHWFHYGEETRGQGMDNFIITFDMYNDTFCEMVLPNSLTKQQHTVYMSRYGESLAIVEIAELDGFEATIHVWVIYEYGVVESWNVLYTLRLTGLPSHIVKPFGFTRNGEIVLDIFCLGLVYVDRNSRQAEKFGIDGSHWCCFVDSFVESFVLLGQANAISD